MEQRKDLEQHRPLFWGGWGRRESLLFWETLFKQEEMHMLWSTEGSVLVVPNLQLVKKRTRLLGKTEILGLRRKTDLLLSPFLGSSHHFHQSPVTASSTVLND